MKQIRLKYLCRSLIYDYFDNGKEFGFKKRGKCFCGEHI